MADDYHFLPNVCLQLPGGSPSFFFINEVALGSLVTLQLQMTPTEVKLCYKREVDAQPVPQSQKMSLPRSFGGESPAQCLEPLLLVCDSNDWTPDAQAAEEEREKERKRERYIIYIYIIHIHINK